MFLAYTFACLMAAYLNVVIAIVMQIEYSVNFTIHVDVNVVDALDTFADSLSGVLLHLNVVKFPATKKKRKVVVSHEFGAGTHPNLIVTSAPARNYSQLLIVSELLISRES